MSEDKAPDSPPQGASSSQNLTEALFGPYIDQCWVTAGVGGDVSTWKGHFYKRDRVDAFDPSRGHYHSIALMKKGAKSRSEFAAGILVVADDIGHVIPDGVSAIAPGAEVDINEFRNDPFIPETSCEVETSHGNFQMTWRIEPPETDYARWHHFLEGAKKHKLLGPAFQKCTGVHYARMETGSNQPKPNRPRFKSRLAKPYNGLTYTLDELAEALGIDMTRPQASVTRAAAGEQLPADKLKKLLELYPNDKAAAYGYDVWVKVGHAIYGATNGSLEGLELYDWWSAQSPLYGVLETPEQKWDGFYNAGASASTLRVLIEEKYGADSPERKAASQLFAGDAFGEIPDDVLAAAAATEEKAKAETEFMALIHEARKLAKIPAKFRKESDDPNWLKDEDFEDAFDLAAVTQPASPTVFAPFDRGVVSVRAGAPFSGKSLLMLDQAAAFTCERHDLLGHGFGPGSIQFAGDVLYFCNEDLRSVAVRRLQAWSKRHGSPKALHKLLLVRSTLMARQDKKPAVIECLRVLRIAVEHLRAGRSLPLIIFDTIRASVSGVDENSAEETAEVLALMKWIAWGFWSAVVFIHHGTKVAWKPGEEQKLGPALSGSGNFIGTVRGADVVRVVAAKELVDKGWAGRKVVGVSTIKASDDDMAGERYYEIETVQVSASHAEVDGLVVSKGMPVVVPLLPVVVAAGFVDEEELAERVETLFSAMASGPVWRFRRTPPKGAPSGEAVHEVWKIATTKASQIVDKLVADGIINVEEREVSKNHFVDEIVHV